MAPKVKGKFVKALAKGKAKTKPLTKGSASSKAKAKKSAALTKSSTGKKVRKGTLKKNQLSKLGKMTLAQKIAKAAENAETSEEAAVNLRSMMNKSEHSRVWSKHHCALKGKSSKEKKAFDKLSKNEKGLEAAVYMIKAAVPRFMHVRENVSQTSSLDKREKWQSEAKMIEEHGLEDFQRHIQSGRIVWREDPWTPGVYNYQDKGDITKYSKIKKEREWSRGQEYAPDEADDEKFGKLWAMDASSHLTQVDWWGKGNGKRAALTKGKGKGKGKGSELLALEDGDVDDSDEEAEHKKNKEEPTKEEKWKTLMTKAKRARDQCTSAMADCEAALQQAESAKRITKTSKKETETLLTKLGSHVEQLKKLLAKKEKAMGYIKGMELLVDVGVLLKETRDETKELKQLANKAGSKASTKK